MFLEYIKNIGRRKHQRGATHRPQGWRARPCLVGHLEAPRCPSSGIRCLSPWRKIRRKLSGRSAAVSRRNLGKTNLGLLLQLFCRGNIPPGGGKRRHRHHHRSSHREGVNLHQHIHQHHLLSNPSSSLVSDLCLKTSDWYLWVASSVDYSL